MRILFMGTPDIAAGCLQKLIDDKFEIIGVVTQPDKPQNRGKKLGMPPVKELALKYDLPVYQPLKARDEEFVKTLQELNPDVIVVVAFGQILPKSILDIPKLGCVNVHVSLLPKYRGAAPINWVIINGEEKTGVTTMYMDEGLDTGDMLLVDKVEIPDNMTSGELFDLLKERGSNLLIETLEGIKNNNIVPIKQEGETCYAKMLDKNIAVINWSDSAENIHNLIRGLNPWPIAYTDYKGQKMKIYESAVLDNKEYSEYGKIIEVNKEGIKVSTGLGTILIKKVQFPNGKPLTVEQYINGHEIEKNILLK